MLATLKTKRLIFTITSGRSGTKLLSVLLRHSVGIEAEHEPAPRLNFVMRSFVNSQDNIPAWLLTEKFPAILASLKGDIYAETSHLFCKGFIEPTLELGLRPGFIILTRPATEVARSLFQLDVIPGRTSQGHLVLLSPADPGVLPLPGWQNYSDYQLCYWYAREIERRQRHYERTLPGYGCASYRIEMKSLLDWNAFTGLARFVTAQDDNLPSRSEFERIIQDNQNPRKGIAKNNIERELPAEMMAEELAVDAAINTAE